MEAETTSLKAAAARLGISYKTAYTLVKTERFPVRVLRIGSQLRVPIAALDRYLEGDEND